MNQKEKGATSKDSSGSPFFSSFTAITIFFWKFKDGKREHASGVGSGLETWKQPQSTIQALFQGTDLERMTPFLTYHSSRCSLGWWWVCIFSILTLHQPPACTCHGSEIQKGAGIPAGTGMPAPPRHWVAVDKLFSLASAPLFSVEKL